MFKKTLLCLTALSTACVSCGQEEINPSEIVLISNRFYVPRTSLYVEPGIILSPSTGYVFETAFQLYKYQFNQPSLRLGVYINTSYIGNLRRRVSPEHTIPDFDVCFKTSNYYGDECNISYMTFDMESIINREFERYVDFELNLRVLRSIFAKQYENVIEGEGYLDFEICFQIKETQEYKTHKEFLGDQESSMCPSHYPKLHYVQYESGLFNFDIIESMY